MFSDTMCRLYLRYGLPAIGFSRNRVSKTNRNGNVTVHLAGDGGTVRKSGSNRVRWKELLCDGSDR